MGRVSYAPHRNYLETGVWKRLPVELDTCTASGGAEVSSSMELPPLRGGNKESVLDRQESKITYDKMAVM